MRIVSMNSILNLFRAAKPQDVPRRIPNIKPKP
jgi:hypothetical protein